MAIEHDLQSLEPTQFENLTFDLLQELGLENLVWRTPGPDGGRDLEGDLPVRDLSGSLIHQRWFVECKRHANSIDWPTVWSKASYAQNNEADFLLVVTTSSLSPACETEIAKWNAGKRQPTIRAWRGYQLERILSRFAPIRLKYGLIRPSVDGGASFVSLALDATKFMQAAYAASELGQNDHIPLEAAAAIAELLSARMQDFATLGRIIVARGDPKVDLYDWLKFSVSFADLPPIDRYGFRALAAAFRAITLSSAINIGEDNGHIVMRSQGETHLAITPAAMGVLRHIALWSDGEITFIEDDAILFAPR